MQAFRTIAHSPVTGATVTDGIGICTGCGTDRARTVVLGIPGSRYVWFGNQRLGYFGRMAVCYMGNSLIQRSQARRYSHGHRDLPARHGVATSGRREGRSQPPDPGSKRSMNAYDSIESSFFA